MTDNTTAIDNVSIDKILSAYKDISLEDLNSSALNAIMHLVQIDALKDRLKERIAISNIDWDKEKSIFINSRKSDYTKGDYTRGIAVFELWASTNKVVPITLSTKEADDYIYSLVGFKYNTVRLYVSSISSFYSFLSRRYKEVVNPFIGTRAMPAFQRHSIIVPTAKEVESVICHIMQCRPMDAAAVAVCAYNGLRIGALPTLKYNSAINCYEGKSKGKALRVSLCEKSLDAIKKARLDIGEPFRALDIVLARRNLYYHNSKLYAVGTIRAVYSHHDFRHFFSVEDYSAHHDIYRLEKLLNHATIKITEVYLKGIMVNI